MARRKDAAGAETGGQGAAESFEETLKELEGIVEALEKGEKPLEESLAMYERGIKALRTCRDILKRAEARMRLLVEKDGKPVVTDPQQHDVHTETDAGEPDADGEDQV